ncbi:MAG: glycoside hydrolase family 127 protein [Cytophagales bacterium]|nr:glycoside hydrolase family 127 protein [Cytophagales bacterium]
MKPLASVKILFWGALLICIFWGASPDSSQPSEADYPIKPVPFTSVQINDDFWKPRLEVNREVTVPYTFQKSEETGRISNFAKAGGLEEGEFEGIYFNDSDVFKIIEGASYALQVHPDPELKKYLDDVIYKIAAAQEEDGYLYTNRTINPSKAADKGGEKRWTSLRVHHELYNVGHLYEAAVAHFRATGERTLLDVAIKNADLVVRVFGPGKNMGVPGHQEIEIGLVRLYRVTGNEAYLNLARFFVDQRGNAAGHKLYGEYSQDHRPLKDQENAVGHSVRAGYYYAGATDIAAITGTVEYDQALNKIWESIVYRKIYLTGGIGAERGHEGFGPDYHLPNATAYTETCAAIALMLWNHRMFLLKGDVKYVDVFERTLYNGFLSGVSFEGNTFFYPNPLETDGKTKFNQGVCGRSPWFDCSCCPVNVVRVLPSLPGYIYATKEKEVYVNLFIGSKAALDIGNKSLSIIQKTNYPWDGKVEFTVESNEQVNAKFNIRVPGWFRNEVMPGDLYRYNDRKDLSLALKVNGVRQEPLTTNGYLVLNERPWKNGDKIEVTFDMEVRKVVSNEKVKANEGKIAIERGPIVYCAEEIDNPEGIFSIDVSDKVQLEYSFDPTVLNGIGKIVAKPQKGSEKAAFVAIPYYSWAHRDIGEMAVWLDGK